MAAAKQQSLAAASGAVAPLKMPDVFSPPLTKVEGKFWAPYVTFAHNKRGDEYTKLVARFGTVSEGEMFLLAEGDMHKLDPLKCALVTYAQFWVHKKENGDILADSDTEKPKPFKEVIETVLLVYLQDRAVFATCKFSGTKSGAGSPLSKELIDCQTPEWLARSEAHAMAAKLAPFGRYFANVRLGDKRTSRETGLPYTPLITTCYPTTSTEWALLKKLQDDPKCQKLMDAVGENFQRRVAVLQAKLPKAA